MARLIVVSGEPGVPDKTVELGTGSLSIGRDPGNGLPLPQEAKASRRHCSLAPVKDGFELVDMESTNGTRVNGGDVKRRVLRHGDVIEVGLTKIRFEDEAQAAKTDPRACFLEYTAGDRKGDVVTLDRPRTTFGRRETNTVPLTDRMASGHHCEIVRDLNGYTLRDLGSTNGTLVNGAPTTEATLTHGTRIRVGNTRFVFKDPAMAHIEVELAAMEEDDAGWGMMGELDLSKAGGGGGGVLTALATVVVVCGLAWWMASRPQKGPEGMVEDRNLVADGSFESKEMFLWTADEGTPAQVERAGAPGHGELVVRHGGNSQDLAVARYSEDFSPKERETYKVSAKLRREGDGTADLAFRWFRRENAKTGAAALSQTVRIGAASAGGASATVSRTVQRPRWAEGARLLVRAGPGTVARADDIAVEREEGDAVALPRFAAPPGDVDVQAGRTGGVYLAKSETVLFVGGSPWAKMPGGRTVGGPDQWRLDGLPSASGEGLEVHGKLVDDQGAVAATVRWSAAPDGVSVQVLAEGAESVGLSVDLPRAHLEAGLGVIGASKSRNVKAQEIAPIDGVSKVIAGDPHRVKRGEKDIPETVILFGLPADTGGKSGGSVESRPSEDAALFRLLLWQPGGSATFKMTTALQGLVQEARSRLSRARGDLQVTPGPAIDELYRISEEYSFVDEVRDEARRLASDREARAAADVGALQDAIARLEVFGSDDAVEEASKRAADLSAQFPKGAVASGPIPESVWGAAARVATVRAAIAVKRAVPEVRRLSKVAETLESKPGYEAVAAVFWNALVWRFGGLDAATGSPEAEEVARKVAEAREHAKTLLAKPETAASVPTVPTDK